MEGIERLPRLEQHVGVAEGAVQSLVADLLKVIDSFIDEGVLVDKVVEGVFEDGVEGVEAIDPGEPVESANAVVQEEISRRDQKTAKRGGS